MAIVFPGRTRNPYAGLREGLMSAVQGWIQGEEKREERNQMGLVGSILEQHSSPEAKFGDLMGAMSQSGISPRYQQWGAEMFLRSRPEVQKEKKHKLMLYPKGGAAYPILVPEGKYNEIVADLRERGIKFTEPEKPTEEAARKITMTKTLSDGRVAKRKNVVLDSDEYKSLEKQGFKPFDISGTPGKVEVTETEALDKIQKLVEAKRTIDMVGTNEFAIMLMGAVNEKVADRMREADPKQSKEMIDMVIDHYLGFIPDKVKREQIKSKAVAGHAVSSYISRHKGK